MNTNQTTTLTHEETLVAVYALGALHHAVATGRVNPMAVAMAKASFPLCKKLGIDLDESVFESGAFPKEP
jgi:hypothetical protein